MAYSAPSITASGTTFAQFQAGGVSGHLEKLITANLGPTAAPTVAHTISATGGGSTGGSLAAGTYYSVVTETNGIGETTVGPEASQLTVGAGNKPRITFQTLKTGNVARNVYLGAVGGPSGGPYYLYAANVTASTYDMVSAVPSNSYAVQPPTVNSTGLTHTDANKITHPEPLAWLRAAERDNGAFGQLYRYLRTLVAGFNRGDPMTFPGVIQKLRHAHIVFALMNTLCTEMGTLIDANPGTLTTAPTGVGGRVSIRTWP